MNKVQRIAILLLILLFTVVFAGCTIISGGRKVYYYERPAIGLTVKDEVTTGIDLEKINSISFTTGNGVIDITPYDGEKLEIIEKKKLTGPSSEKILGEMLEKNKLNIEKDSMEVKLNSNPEEKQKALFSLIIDIEIKVPEEVKSLDIVSKSGEIRASGLEGKQSLRFKLDKGNIEVDNCEANQIFTTIESGNLDVGNSSGAGICKSGRGNISIQNLKGNIELNSLSGDTIIKKAEGRLKCDISSGSLAVEESRVKKDSELYTSYGDIKADFTNLDTEGKYTVKASKGSISLKLPETEGWSLLAESTKGKVTENIGQDAGVLKTAPSGEVYGDVRGGGPLIDAYIDMGNIILH